MNGQRKGRGAWYRMPENVKVRAVDVERALTAIGQAPSEAMSYVRRHVTPLVAAGKTYVYRVPE